MHGRALIALLLFACGPTGSALDATPSEGDAGTTDARHVADGGESTGCSQIDVLFVIDRSTSMLDEKQNLLDNFPVFIQTLDDTEALPVAIDYRVAVIDDTLSHLQDNFAADHWIDGHDGVLHAPEQCGLPRPWVERADANRAEAFTCLADIELDDTITTYEMPLGALAASLEPSRQGGAAESFLRPDALLGVIVLTDEDDHTADTIPWQEAEDGCPVDEPSYVRPVTEIVASLDQAKGERKRWAVAVIAGTGPGDCQSNFGGACEARRLQELASLAGPQGVSESICAQDLTPAIEEALTSFREACGRIID